MSIVPTNVSYNSGILRLNLMNLVQTYPFLNLQTVGKSVLGTPIYAIKLGISQKKVFYSASIHANEWITSVLLMKFIEDYCIAYTKNSTLYGFSVKNLYRDVSIYIMPMVNPDGVDLVTGYLQNNISAYQAAHFIASEFPAIPFPSGWKANIRGVNFLNFQPFFIILMN